MSRIWKHSIYADPLHQSAERRIFDIPPDSPNVGAGENGPSTKLGAALSVSKGGATIGAFQPAASAP